MGKLGTKFWIGYNQSLQKQINKKIHNNHCYECGKTPVKYEMKFWFKKNRFYCVGCGKKFMEDVKKDEK